MKFFTLFFAFVLSGCASTGVGINLDKITVAEYITKLPKPSPDKAQLVVYRDTGFDPLAYGLSVLMDGKELVNIGNKKFEVINITPGAKEVKVFSCVKSIFISPNTINYLKIAKRPEYSELLMLLIPIASIVVENQAEKSTRCGGQFEPFVMNEDDAKKDLIEMSSK